MLQRRKLYNIKFSSMSRLDKINSVLKKHAAEIIHRQVEFPLGVFITISDVDTSSNLGNANIWISVVPKSSEKEVLDVLKSEIYYIQKELNKRLTMRHVPKIRFVIDHREERAASIEKIIEQEHQGDES